MFFILEIRPDIAFTTSVASRLAKNPSYQYIKAIETIVKYKKGSKPQDITYIGEQKLLVERYSDFIELKSKRVEIQPWFSALC